MMNIEEKESPKILSMTIADFLQEEKRGSRLLQVLGIPAKGNEHKTLMEVCTTGQRNEDEVIKEIERLKQGAEFDYPEGIFSWSPELVIRYLEEEHHNYTCSLISDAEDYGERAWDVHGTQYPELNQVKWYVQKLKKKLEMHLNFEEQKFFPKMLKFFEMNGETKDGTVQSLKKQTEIIEKDQEEIEYFIQRIRDLTDNFTPPKEACTTFRLLYFTLQKLDEDLEKHHFLEEQYVLSKLKTKLENIIS
ncbi:MAG TPA: hemerythrin domain-containing protein [Gracilimonas sp.]|uniref:hemerythrin domain-containing protein n=1 Tax=Gracilimonas sp. TaxID=1974203 RepID=UPI002D9C1BEB|nr:hemerythrin domain-containing protein [Gracilimonas sp.]